LRRLAVTDREHARKTHGHWRKTSKPAGDNIAVRSSKKESSQVTAAELDE
jgi:hypothetical protein